MVSAARWIRENVIVALGRWIGKHLVLALGVLVMLFLYLPNGIVALMSFNDASAHPNVYSFQTFTTDNWLHPCAPAGMCGSLVTSVQIGLLATIFATIMGTLAAFGLVRHRFEGRSTMNLVLFLPMATPEIVMGSSLLALFVSVGLAGKLGFWTILVAHIMFCLSFVVVTVKSRLAGLDSKLEQAAMDLYANEWQTFWRITFPLVFPGVLAAALLSFSLSFDDFIITNLNAGQTLTFPMYVWGAAQRHVPMQVNVVGTTMLLVALTIVIVGEVGSRRKAKVLASR
jgi:spermidine/putrescine transport system permease protein